MQLLSSPTNTGLVLLAPGGGQDLTSPGIVARTRKLHDAQLGVAIVTSHDDVAAALSTHEDGPVGFWGISEGCRLGLATIATNPRITAAVLGLADGPLDLAPSIKPAVLFYVQSDDDLVDPEACRRLFAALGSKDKTIIENPGGHLALPRSAADESVSWLAARLREDTMTA